MTSGEDIPWVPVTPSTLVAAPEHVRPWIALETSMTAQVSATLRAPISVILARQEQGDMAADEVRALGSRSQRGMIREVCLTDGKRRALVARTVYTSNNLEALCGEQALGQTPLGSLLFAGSLPPEVTLREMAEIHPTMALYPLIASFVGACGPCWARRSRFLLNDQPLLVTEIFLPDLLS